MPGARASQRHMVEGNIRNVDGRSFFFLILKYLIDKNGIYLRCTMWWFNIHIHYVTISTVNTSITNRIICVCVCACVSVSVICSSNLLFYQISSTQCVLTILNTLYIRSPEFIHLMMKFHTFWLTSPHFPNRPAPGSPSSMLCFYELDFLRFHM